MSVDIIYMSLMYEEKAVKACDIIANLMCERCSRRSSVPSVGSLGEPVYNNKLDVQT